MVNLAEDLQNNGASHHADKAPSKKSKRALRRRTMVLPILALTLLLGIVSAAASDKVRVGVFVETTPPTSDNQDWKSVVVAAALATKHFNERDESIIEDLVDVGSCAQDLETVFIRVEVCAHKAIEDQILQHQLDVVLGGYACTDRGDSAPALALAAETVGVPFLALGPILDPDQGEDGPEMDEMLAMAAPTYASADALVDLYVKFGHSRVVLLYEETSQGKAWRRSLEQATVRSQALKITALAVDPESPEAIEVAVDAARRSGVRSVFAALSDNTLDNVLAQAHRMDMLGPAWMWVFADTVDVKTLQQSAFPLEGSLHVQGGGLEHSRHQDKKAWELLSYWMDNASPATIEELVNETGYEVDLFLDAKASFTFDAVCAIGFSLCPGKGVVSAQGFAKTVFRGTSGLVVFDSDGQRLQASMTVYLRNLVEGDSLGFRQDVVAEYLGETWAFTRQPVFASGSTRPPADGSRGLAPAANHSIGYMRGHVDAPSCWVTYLDPQHVRYAQGQPELLAACPRGLGIALESGLSAGRSSSASVRLQIGSAECPNKLGDCQVGAVTATSSSRDRLASFQLRGCSPASEPWSCTPFADLDGSTLSDPRSERAIFTRADGVDGQYSVQTEYEARADDSIVLAHARVTTEDGVRYDIARVVSVGTTQTPPVAPGEDLVCSEAQDETSATGSCPSGMTLAVDFGPSSVDGAGAKRAKEARTSLLASVSRPVRLQFELDRAASQNWLPAAHAQLMYCRASSPVCTSEAAMGEVPLHASSVGARSLFEGDLVVPLTGDFAVTFSVFVRRADGQARIAVSRTLYVSVLASSGAHVASIASSEDIIEQGYHLGHFNESICWKASSPSSADASELIHLASEQEARCPAGMWLAFTHQPRRLVSKSELAAFSIEAELALGTPTDPAALGENGEFPLASLDGVDVAHANFHFCDRKIQFCNPLLRGLSSDLYSTTVPVQLNREDKESPLEFLFAAPPVSLVDGMYTVLAHVRLYSDEGAIRWDMATAFPLQVGEVATDDLSLIPASLHTVGLMAVGVLWAVIACLAVWVVRNRAHMVLQIAQVRFLGMVLLGIALIGVNVVLNGVEDTAQDRADTAGGNAVADASCMGNLVTYCLGFALTFGPLLAKLEKTLADYDGQPLRRINLTYRQLVRTSACVLGPDAVICMIWLLHDRPVFARHDVAIDPMGFPLKSAGQCTSKHFTSYILSLLAVHGAAATMGALYAFRTINFKTAFSEARYVSIALLAAIIPYAFVVPILYLVESSSSSRFALVAVFAIVSSFTTLFIVFFPKLVFVVGSKTSSLRQSLEIDETYEAKVSPANSPTGSPFPFKVSPDQRQQKSPQEPKTLGFAVTPVDGLSTLSIRPIASDWIDPDSDDDDQTDLDAIVYKTSI